VSLDRYFPDGACQTPSKEPFLCNLHPFISLPRFFRRWGKLVVANHIWQSGFLARSTYWGSRSSGFFHVLVVHPHSVNYSHFGLTHANCGICRLIDVTNQTAVRTMLPHVRHAARFGILRVWSGFFYARGAYASWRSSGAAIAYPVADGVVQQTPDVGA
jgi:hypothetical protein